MHSAPGNLPSTLAPLVGRAAERAMLLSALDDSACRLITLVGPSGVGKTTLALDVAREVMLRDDAAGPRGGGAFGDGAYFVPVGELADVGIASGSSGRLEDALATAIAEAIGLPLSAPESPWRQVRGHLREKAMLLLFDNLDSFVRRITPLALALLKATQRLRIMATSWERMGIGGERVVVLGGLPYPRLLPDGGNLSAGIEAFDSVALFRQIAQAMGVEVATTPAAVAAMVRICQLVDGLPLGIELAASWTRVLTPQEIAAEIAGNLDFLDASDLNRDAPQRQHSLRAAFEHSWALLSEAEGGALRRLAVFRGSFTREAAKVVADASLTVLASLIDKSLVRRLGAEGNAAPCFELLAPLRELARAKLEQAGEADVVQRRYAAHYVALLERATPALRGSDQRDALNAIVEDMSHVRAAWSTAVAAGDAAAIRRAADSLFHVYDMRSGFTEGEAAFGAASRALAAATATSTATSTATASSTAAVDEAALGKVLARQAWFTFQLGRQAEAKALFGQSLALLRTAGASADPADLAFTLSYLGAVCQYLGEFETTRALCTESLRLTERSGDEYGQVIACNILGQTAFDEGDYAAARDWCRRSVRLDEKLGNRWSMAYTLINLGKAAFAQKQWDEARRLFEESLGIREDMRDPRGVAFCLSWLGDVAGAKGNLVAAGEYYMRALAIFRDISNKWGMAATLTKLGQLALSNGRTAGARILQEAIRLAMDTRSAPQLKQILALAAPLVKQAGDPAWADDLARLTSTRVSGDAAGDATLDPLRAQADKLLDWLLASADSITLLSLEAALVQAVAPPDVSPPAQGAPAFKLTAREVEVLRLVAEGLTDAQVAERLVLSVRTITTHLTSIYTKLGVSTRTAAARIAIERGLVSSSR